MYVAGKLADSQIMKALTGQFLIAAPSLIDPNFLRSVVLMINHDKEGALGVILNRPIHNPLTEIWDELGVESQSGRAIYLGGPVPGPIIVVHASEKYSTGRIMDGVYVASEREAIQEMIQTGVSPCRIIVGYAGWAAGQLENEMRAGGWLTLPATSDRVFADPSEQWEKFVRDVADIVLQSAREGIVQPLDPSLN